MNTSDSYLENIVKSNEWFKNNCEVLGKKKKRRRFKTFNILVAQNGKVESRKVKRYL